jgi:transcriptional regulator with XRE-family HTH domain
VAFGARLKELRVKKGESLQDVADAVKASKAHIWELETGKSRNPSMELLAAIASHFAVSVASLVGEDTADDPKLVGMYRELKGLSEGDRETIRLLMNRLQSQSGAKGGDKPD